jgi:hypothetical protein
MSMLMTAMTTSNSIRVKPPLIARNGRDMSRAPFAGRAYRLEELPLGVAREPRALEVAGSWTLRSGMTMTLLA